MQRMQCLILSLHDQVSLELGTRYEDSKQVLNIFNNQTGEEFVDGAAENITQDLLPSLLATYKLNDDMQLRLGYSRTMSRPNFKELHKLSFLIQIHSILT
jgi:outer membrane receptor protein involved in Fe transport